MAEIKKLNSKRKNDNSQEDFSFDDFLTMLQQKLGIDVDSLMDDEPEEADNEDDNYSEEDYMYGLKLPKHKFIGTSKREYHIRIKLNDAPVKIWRELVAPSNITLELLAFVLIDAMGWAHEHLYQFRGKNDVIYMNSHEIREHKNSFFGFLSRVQYVNTETTSLDRFYNLREEDLSLNTIWVILGYTMYGLRVPVIMRRTRSLLSNF